VREHHLDGLHPGRRTRIAAAAGVKGDGAGDPEVHGAVRQPQAAAGITRRINEYRPALAISSAGQADEGRDLKLHDPEVKVRRSHILQYALAGLRPELRKLLSQVAASAPVGLRDDQRFNPYLPRPLKVEEPDTERIERDRKIC